MQYKCPQCGHLSAEAGNCPMCNVPMQPVTGDVQAAPTTPVEPAPEQTPTPPPVAEPSVPPAAPVEKPAEEPKQ